MSKEPEVTTELEELKPQFGFIVIKDHSGNVGLKPLEAGSPLTTDQIYQACDAICRNIKASEIAEQVATHVRNDLIALKKDKASDLVIPTIKGT